MTKRRCSIKIRGGNSGGCLDRYMSLEQYGKVQAEYVWVGGTGLDIRSKTKTLDEAITKLSDLPEWNFDGSSTKQAEGHDSEVWLKPIKYIPDPFRRGNNIIVLCECLNASTMEPLQTNKRAPALKIFELESVKSEIPWYGIEQEYTLFEEDGTTPLGWPSNGYPRPQGPYYCGNGTRNAYGRNIVESHYRCCLYSELNISGINAEVMPGQWEFQIGPCTGIDAGDQVWLARYLLERVAEDFNVCVSFEPKPITGDWNGAGAHTNFSTKSMRNKSEDRCGYDTIIKACEKLGESHSKHMVVYGKGNENRLTGKHETANFNEFSYGVANRGASIRIPRQTHMDGYGYLEDRRPSANCDPYDVSSIIAQTVLTQN